MPVNDSKIDRCRKSFEMIFHSLREFRGCRDEPKTNFRCVMLLFTTSFRHNTISIIITRSMLQSERVHNGKSIAWSSLHSTQLSELNQHDSEMEICRIVENNDELPTAHSTYHLFTHSQRILQLAKYVFICSAGTRSHGAHCRHCFDHELTPDQALHACNHLVAIGLRTEKENVAEIFIVFSATKVYDL